MDVRDLENYALRVVRVLCHEQAVALTDIGDSLAIGHLVFHSSFAILCLDDRNVAAHTGWHNRIASPGVNRDLHLGPPDLPRVYGADHTSGRHPARQREEVAAANLATGVLGRK